MYFYLNGIYNYLLIIIIYFCIDLFVKWLIIINVCVCMRIYSKVLRENILIFIWNMIGRNLGILYLFNKCLYIVMIIVFF